MRRCVPLVVVLALMAGCQKLNYEKTHEVGMVAFVPLDFSAPAYNQNVKVTISPEDAAVSAYLVKKSDVEELEKALNLNKADQAKYVLASRTFGRKDPRQEYTLEANIPARTEYTLVLYGGSKSTQVKVKVVGK